MTFFRSFILFAVATLLALPQTARAEVWAYKKEFLQQLLLHVPRILKSQDPKTGQFRDDKPWIVTDQNVMYLLAVAWSYKNPENPYYHSSEVLNAIMDGGDALIKDMKPDGQWEFRKKDGSTWGNIYMPWTYSRWIRAYALVHDAMPPDRRAKWDKAMTLGFGGIREHQLKKAMQNIPAHNAMGLYLASKVLKHPEWEKPAVDYLHKCAKAQFPDGYWTEHKGPVVLYNGVYVDLLGTYYGMSGDEAVLPALEAASRFHAHMVYPDGSRVETVDERNPYEKGGAALNIGFCFTPEGRRLCKNQFALARQHKKNEDAPAISADMAASFLLYGVEAEMAPEAQSGDAYVFKDKQAMTRRSGPWFICLSAYHAAPSTQRWIQDRQNFLSLYNDETGLILGGGNTKLQPLWSTFTVGDTNLLQRKKGDENPNFIAPPGLKHIPTDSNLHPQQTALDLDYGGVKCSVTVDISDPKCAKVVYTLASLDQPDVEAHVTLLPAMKQPWQTASGKSGKLSEENFKFAPGEAGAWFEHGGWRITVPPQASIQWPLLPHNPYTKDGHAEAHEGRIVMTLPFSQDLTRYELTVQVP